VRYRISDGVYLGHEQLKGSGVKAELQNAEEVPHFGLMTHPKWYVVSLPLLSWRRRRIDACVFRVISIVFDWLRSLEDLSLRDTPLSSLLSSQIKELQIHIAFKRRDYDLRNYVSTITKLLARSDQVVFRTSHSLRLRRLYRLWPIATMVSHYHITHSFSLDTSLQIMYLFDSWSESCQ
jgi:hypothetical protein